MLPLFKSVLLRSIILIIKSLSKYLKRRWAYFGNLFLKTATLIAEYYVLVEAKIKETHFLFLNFRLENQMEKQIKYSFDKNNEKAIHHLKFSSILHGLKRSLDA